jgi:transposase
MIKLSSDNSARRWVRAEKEPTTLATKKKVLNLTNQYELSRLRKEVEKLRMEREILHGAL